MEFRIGGTYRNRKGEYEVLDIRGDMIVARYDDRTVIELTQSTQRRIAENMALEAQLREPSTDERVNRAYFRTIGYLAAHTTVLEGFAPPRAVAGFRDTYRQLTGRELRDEKGFYPHSRETDKWGVELRVQFPAAAPGLALDFGASDIGVVAAPNRELRINSNRFIKDLFRIGFVLGGRQDLERIGSRVPTSYQSEFNAGAVWPPA